MGQIEDFKLFVEIVDQGSISKAAETMNIAKSAVSRRLAMLEARYGTKLIHRAPGQWGISDIGKEFYQRAVSVVGEVDAIQGDFSPNPHHVEGPLSVSIAHEFGLMMLSPALIQFQKKYPDIQLNAVFDNRTVDLENDNFDFAIRVTPKLINDPNAKVIGESRYGFYASKSYLDSHGTPQTLGELVHHRILNYGAVKRTDWFAKLHDHNSARVSFHPALASNSGVFLLDAVINGLGIARLPDFVLRNELETGKVCKILPDVSFDLFHVYLLRPENRRFNRRMRLFSTEMERACELASGQD